LSGLPTGFNLTTSNITNVRFQYGTSLSQTNFTDLTGDDLDLGDEDDGVVPEPMSLAIWGSISALCAIGAYRRRKLAAKA
jgi:hypothetical protein